MNKEAYILGYMEKTSAPGAGVGGAISNLVMGGAEVSMQILDRLKTAALVAPLIAGATGGAAMSMITSPSQRSMDTIGKEIVNAELKQSLAQAKRRRELALQDNGPAKNEREVFLGA